MVDSSIEFTPVIREKGKVLLIVDNQKFSLIAVINHFFVTKKQHYIDPSSVIHPNAKIGMNVFIGANCYIGDCIIGNNNVIHANVLPREIVSHTPDHTATAMSEVVREVSKNIIPDLKGAASQAEYETILNVLKQVNYNKTKAAGILKIDRKTLYNKIKEYEMQKQANDMNE